MLKTCTKCGVTKPLSEFNTRPGRPGSGNIYYRSDCRQCEYARHRANSQVWYEQNAKGHKINVTDARKRRRNAKA